jgi:chromosome segregation ATPase
MQYSDIMGGRFPKLRVIYQMQEEVFKMKKQSNEEKDGHIQLVTLQKKQQIQTMKRLKNEADAAKVEADQREFGLNSQNLSLNSLLPTEMQLKKEASTCVGTLQGDAKTLQGEFETFKAQAVTHIGTLQGEFKTLEKEADTLKQELKEAADKAKRLQFKYKQAEKEKNSYI